MKVSNRKKYVFYYRKYNWNHSKIILFHLEGFEINFFKINYKNSMKISLSVHNLMKRRKARFYSLKKLGLYFTDISLMTGIPIMTIRGICKSEEKNGIC